MEGRGIPPALHRVRRPIDEAVGGGFRPASDTESAPLVSIVDIPRVDCYSPYAAYARKGPPVKSHLGKLAAAGLLLVAVPVTSVGAKFASKSDSGAAVYVRDDATCTPLQDNTIDNSDMIFYAVVKHPSNVDPVGDLVYRLKDKNGSALIDDYFETGCEGPYSVVKFDDVDIDLRLGSHTLVVNYTDGKTFANNSFRFIAP